MITGFIKGLYEFILYLLIDNTKGIAEVQVINVPPPLYDICHFTNSLVFSSKCPFCSLSLTEQSVWAACEVGSR